MRKIWRLVAMGWLVAALAGCGGYYRAEDAPGSFGSGTDLRLGLMQAFGPPLSPVVRNIRTPHGKLSRFAEVEAMLRRELRPLDIVLVRSRPALTRAFIPSHFTHAMIWLGDEAGMRRNGAWASPAVRLRGAELAGGLTVLESSKDSVHLSPFTEMLEVDEVLVLHASPRRPARRSYEALFERLGTPFDVAFDLSDASRLTCAELIAEVFPEFRLPVRYASGRLAIIPDDIARRALDGSPHLFFALSIRAEGGSFVVGKPSDLRRRLTTPRTR